MFRTTRRAILRTKIFRQKSAERFFHEYIDFWLLSCNEPESNAVRSLSTQWLIDLARGVKFQLLVDTPTPQISMLCIGEAVTPISVSAWINNLPYLRQGSGVWLPSHGLGIVDISKHRNPQQTIIHEISHGLIEGLSRGFKYPAALEEGLCRILDNSVTRVNGLPIKLSVTDQCASRSQEFLNSSDCIPAQELLALRLSGAEYSDCEVKIATVGPWLYGFLTALGRRTPALRQLLGQIRRNCLQDPEKIYAWILQETRLSSEQFEKGFAAYCTTGAELPRE